MNKVMTRAGHHPRHPPAQPTATSAAPAAHRLARRAEAQPAPRPRTAVRRAPRRGRGAALRTRPTDDRPPTSSPAARTAPTPAPAGAVAPVVPVAPVAPVRDPRGPLPQPRPTDLFADRLLAVLSGRRPVHWMLRHTAGRAYDELAWLAERGPLRTTRGTAPVVRDIGYYVPRPGAIEAFARIAAGDQLRAMAFRLEQGRRPALALHGGGTGRPAQAAHRRRLTPTAPRAPVTPCRRAGHPR